MAVLEVLAAVVFIIAALAFKKVKDARGNIPSPGIFWFRSANKKTCGDLSNYVNASKAKVVHAFSVPRSYKWYNIHTLVRSYALATHPDTAQIVLKDEETFEKDPQSFGDFSELLRTSMINTNHGEWRATKDIMGPTFHATTITNHAPMFLKKAEDLLNLWEETGGNNIDIWQDVTHFTIDALGIAAFGIDFNSVRGGIHDYMVAYDKLVHFNPSRTTEMREDLQNRIANLLDDIVKNKKAAPQKNKDEMDLLDRLIEGGVSGAKLRDNIFLFFFAGNDTTATALTYATYYLAKYPEIQKRVQEEVDTVLQGKIPDAESLKSLPYLDMFIKEVLRIRPSGATPVTRIAVKDTQLGEYFIPKGTRVGVSIYSIQHLEEFWPEHEKFDPLRFSPENSSGRHPYAYLPFSLGRRNCIGNHFSLLEQRLFIARAAQRFNFSVHPDCNTDFVPYWILSHPKNMRLNATPRHTQTR